MADITKHIRIVLSDDVAENVASGRSRLLSFCLAEDVVLEQGEEVLVSLESEQWYAEHECDGVVLAGHVCFGDHCEGGLAERLAAAESAARAAQEFIWGSSLPLAFDTGFPALRDAVTAWRRAVGTEQWPGERSHNR